MKFPFLLTCHHVTEIDTRSRAFVDDERVFCVFCQEDSLVLTIHLPEWHAICRTGNCHFGRWAGQSKDTAKWHANRHHMRTGHMNVDTEYADNPMNITERDRLRKAGILRANLHDHRLQVVL